jgi:hypothetical protein
MIESENYLKQFLLKGTNQSSQRSVSVFVHKTLNSVLKNSRKFIFRVCEVANVKKQIKMFNLYSTMNRRNDDREQKGILDGHLMKCYWGSAGQWKEQKTEL